MPLWTSNPSQNGGAIRVDGELPRNQRTPIECESMEILMSFLGSSEDA